MEEKGMFGFTMESLTGAASLMNSADIAIGGAVKGLVETTSDIETELKVVGFGLVAHGVASFLDGVGAQIPGVSEATDLVIGEYLRQGANLAMAGAAVSVANKLMSNTGKAIKEHVAVKPSTKKK